jgi:hypothetical protein
MSLDDLREQGILLPENEWGAHRLETTVQQGRLTVAFGLAVASAVVVYLGAGGRWTWIGLVAFLISLYWVIWICDRAIVRQRRRQRRERQALKAEPGSGGADGHPEPPDDERDRG